MTQSGERSVSAGRDMIGNAIVTGDHSSARLRTTALPPADTVDIAAVLAELRAQLAALGGAEAGKIGRALDDATEEAAKPAPDKAEVAGALDRAIGYAKKTGEFAEAAGKLEPLVTKIAGWIGSAAHYAPLLAAVGLAAG